MEYMEEFLWHVNFTWVLQELAPAVSFLYPAPECLNIEYFFQRQRLCVFLSEVLGWANLDCTEQIQASFFDILPMDYSCLCEIMAKH